MGTVPTPEELQALYRESPIIDAAEAALRSFGDLTREQAGRLLATWAHTPSLTARERAALVARFPVPASDGAGDHDAEHGNSGPGGAL
jgi:hypothetical protein